MFLCEHEQFVSRKFASHSAREQQIHSGLRREPTWRNKNQEAQDFRATSPLSVQVTWGKASQYKLAVEPLPPSVSPAEQSARGLGQTGEVVVMQRRNLTKWLEYSQTKSPNRAELCKLTPSCELSSVGEQFKSSITLWIVTPNCHRTLFHYEHIHMSDSTSTTVKPWTLKIMPINKYCGSHMIKQKLF